jgi:hypothetical protein
MCKCDHNYEKTIVVLQAFEMFEQIGIRCTNCNEIIEIIN